VFSLTQRPLVPEQRRVPVVVPHTHVGLAALASTVAGGGVALLPGLGPAQAATAVRTIWSRMRQETYLLLMGGINTANMALSLVTIAALGFARNGSLEVMRQLSDAPDWHTFALLAGVALVAGGIAAALAIFLGRTASNFMARVNYALLSGAVLCLVAGLVAWRTGPIGLLILVVATATGLVAVLTGAARQQLMACIMVPVIWAMI
jgi:TctA family transporter